MAHTFVVSREHPILFRYMSAQFADVPVVSVMLDRRHGERRRQRAAVAVERRHEERRATPPRTWTEIGFVIVSLSALSEPERVIA
jgi:hypothetical protein